MVSEMLQLYILGKPPNLADLMHEMGWYHGHDFKRKIFQNKNILPVLIEQINNAYDLEEIGKIIYGIPYEGRFGTLESIDSDKFNSKINDAKLDEIHDFFFQIGIFPPLCEEYEFLLYKMVIIDNLSVIISKYKKASTKDRIKISLAWLYGNEYVWSKISEAMRNIS